MTKVFGSPTKEGTYTTLMMSTGLTFGSISALFGLTHGIVSAARYSYLIASVAIVPGPVRI
jgi:glutathione-regulated potassium-efflux system ancillary protein KefC